MRPFSRLSLVFVLLSGLGAAAQAAPGTPENPAIEALSAAQTSHDGSPFLAGFSLELAPGWKTYWRNPGESGIPPRFDWSEAENVASVQLRWPTPNRFEIGGETIFGYEDQVTFPLLVSAKNPAKPVTLRLKVDYAVCSTLCVPRSAELILSIPPGEPQPTPEAAHLLHAMALVPKSFESQDDIAVTLQEGAEPGLLISCALCAGRAVPPSLFMDHPQGIYAGMPIIEQQGGGLLYRVPLEHDKDVSLRGQTWKMIFAWNEGAIEVERHLP